MHGGKGRIYTKPFTSLRVNMFELGKKADNMYYCDNMYGRKAYRDAPVGSKHEACNYLIVCRR